MIIMKIIYTFIFSLIIIIFFDIYQFNYLFLIENSENLDYFLNLKFDNSYSLHRNILRESVENSNINQHSNNSCSFKGVKNYISTKLENIRDINLGIGIDVDKWRLRKETLKVFLLRRRI